jgi:hypothetical protein
MYFPRSGRCLARQEKEILRVVGNTKCLRDSRIVVVQRNLGG